MKTIVAIGLAVSLAIAALLSPLASRLPDGLERVAELMGFLGRSEGKTMISSPCSDYRIPLVRNEHISGVMAGALGVLLTFAVACILGVIIQRKTM